MHRALTARCLNRALRLGELSSSSSVPLFLCPAVLRTTGLTRGRQSFQASYRRALHVDAIAADTATPSPQPSGLPKRKLPVTCSGCGAFTQTEDPQQFGYLNLETKRVKSWIQPEATPKHPTDPDEDKVVQDALAHLDMGQLGDLGINPADFMPRGKSTMALAAAEKPPVCERCHNLLHHSTTGDTAKLTMYHPTVETLRETIEESPHKYNHIYHIIDAADFPMSLIPRLNVLLGDVPLRTRNRRSRSAKYMADRKTEMSFIITRGDLLGPRKEIVDNMMPYLRDVLRDALGRLGGRVRLGNIKCVSAKRGWWTKSLKEDIWQRGGAGWMVGKVNVGKSQLFEAVYPKNRTATGKAANEVSLAAYPRKSLNAESIPGDVDHGSQWEDIDYGELLPPLQPAQDFPDMPVVSSLPGTTASPIRIPFGQGKGELIDLPGMARSDLELFVKEEHRQSLVMKSRIVPEQITVRPKQSLLLGGGLIRITPRTPNMVFLMYNFTPIDEHLTLTEKAVGFQEQSKESVGLENISLPGVGEKIKHAGTFKLCHDVTRRRAGPLTRKNAVGLQVDRLPFRVLSVDILVEGVGYVEIVAQVRARDAARYPPIQPFLVEEEESPVKRLKQRIDSNDPFASMLVNRKDDRAVASVTKALPPLSPPPELDWPAVDVYTPEGRFIGSRQPINGWLTNKPLVRPEHKRSRPRTSMKGHKKTEKRRAREAANESG